MIILKMIYFGQKQSERDCNFNMKFGVEIVMRCSSVYFHFPHQIRYSPLLTLFQLWNDPPQKEFDIMEYFLNPSQLRSEIRMTGCLVIIDTSYTPVLLHLKSPITSRSTDYTLNAKCDRTESDAVRISIKINLSDFLMYQHFWIC